MIVPRVTIVHYAFDVCTMSHPEKKMQMLQNWNKKANLADQATTAESEGVNISGPRSFIRAGKEKKKVYGNREGGERNRQKQKEYRRQDETKLAMIVQDQQQGYWWELNSRPSHANENDGRDKHGHFRLRLKETLAELYIESGNLQHTQTCCPSRLRWTSLQEATDRKIRMEGANSRCSVSLLLMKCRWSAHWSPIFFRFLQCKGDHIVIM